MSLYTRLAASVLFPAHERLKRHSTVAVRRALERSQWWSAAELGDYQVRELRRFLTRIGTDVAYFATLFREQGFDPAAVESLADLRRLPRMDKACFRQHHAALISATATGLATCSTGGSSGEPLEFLLGRERVSHDVAAKWRATRWWGVDIGDPEIVLWGSPIELGAQDRLRQWRDRLLRTELLSAFEMDAAHLDAFLDRLRARRPRMLFGYPSSLALLAEHARRAGRRMDDLGIRVAFVTSERLYDHQQEVIERVFACPVANGYGGRDAGFVAHACPEGSLHITAEDILVEILDSEGQPVPPGAPGEIVVTHLRTGDYPFVRYRTGDVGVLGEDACPCGRSLPVLARVEGRSTDFVTAQDGKQLHGLALIYILRDMPDVEAFRVVQESLALTRVEVVPGQGFDDASERRITEGFRKRLGAGVEVRIERHAVLPKAASGKFRYVQSKVTPS